MLELDVSGNTHRGLNQLRPTNQDGLFYSNNVFAVVDGMGGYGGGDQARDITIEAIQERSGKPPVDESETDSWLQETFTLANDRICNAQASTLDPAFKKMGATAILAVAIVAARKLFIGHLGNARAYRLRDTRLERLTRDHLILIDAGLTEEEVAKHRLRSVVSRCVGRYPMADIAYNQSEIETGDLFLLCSDGLSGYVAESNIQAILTSKKNASELASDLLEAALTSGGQDNVTALVIRALRAPSTDVNLVSETKVLESYAIIYASK